MRSIIDVLTSREESQERNVIGRHGKNVIMAPPQATAPQPPESPPTPKNKEKKTIQNTHDAKWTCSNSYVAAGQNAYVSTWNRQNLSAPWIWGILDLKVLVNALFEKNVWKWKMKNMKKWKKWKMKKWKMEKMKNERRKNENNNNNNKQTNKQTNNYMKMQLEDLWCYLDSSSTHWSLGKNKCVIGGSLEVKSSLSFSQGSAFSHEWPCQNKLVRLDEF